MSFGIYINIGNTHVQTASVKGGKISLLSVCDTSELLEDGTLPEMENDAALTGCAACVVPEVRHEMVRRYGDRLRFLQSADFSVLDFSLVDSSTIGIDRLANAVAARSLTGGPVIVVDCGTCINTVAVDGSWKFLGGAIMPGRQLMRKALNSGTAQLPLVEIKNEIPSPVGTCTPDAIAAGTDLAAVGALREVISRTVKYLEPEEYTVCATGGDAEYFLKALPDIMVPAPDFLTLYGTFLTGNSL